MENFQSQEHYLFKILWSKTCIGIGINQIYQKDYNLPLTTFYFWPQEDGWKLLKEELDSKPWMAKTKKQEILNGYTLIVNYWLSNIHKNVNLYNPQLKIPNLQIDLLGVNSIN